MTKKLNSALTFTDAFALPDLTPRSKIERQQIKAWAFNAGLVPLYHRLRNRSCLTTVMFHRVLPADSAERAYTNDDYVLTTDLFRQCLTFFVEHYTVVSLEQVLAAARGDASLPSYPLLITFDDGWLDTWEVAAPILQEYRLPAACFVIGDVLTEGGQVRWQDAFAFAWRGRRVTEPMVRDAWLKFGYALLPNADISGTSPYLRSAAMMQDLPPSIRFEFLEQWMGDDRFDHPSEMITAEQCLALHRAGISIGAHGASHTALPHHRHARADLAKAKLEIDWACHGAAHTVETLSFPHGQFTDEIVKDARDVGYRLMFNSYPYLTELRGGMLPAENCGRIEIATRHVIDSKGCFRPDFLGLHLFTRPVRSAASAP